MDMNMDLLTNMGLNPEHLEREDIERMGKVIEENKITTSMDPNTILSKFRKAGVDIDAIIKKLRSKDQKKSQRIGRNEKCKCGSGKKYKKCCL